MYMTFIEYFYSLEFSELHVDSVGDFTFKFYNLFPAYMMLISPWNSE